MYIHSFSLYAHACADDQLPDCVTRSQLAELNAGNVNEDSNVVESMVRGCYVYKEILNATVGQYLHCQQDTGNLHHPYTVANMERDVNVGHMPQEISMSLATYLVLTHSTSYWQLQ